MSRDFLCASCVDYLIAYHPLWLNPALLPGPSLLDFVSPRAVPLVSADLTQIEWETPRDAPRAAGAVQLIHLLGLKEGAHPTLSVGDAELLHTFLRDARRSTPGQSEERDALAAMYHYLSTCDWMPSHLAADYRLRANVLETPGAEAPTEAVMVEEPIDEVPASPPPLPESEPAEEEPSEPLPELPEKDFDLEEEAVPLPAPDPFRPEPIPEPEPPLPLPEPIPEPGPEPQPEPEPEPEEARVDMAKWTEFEALQHSLERERVDLEASARSRSEELRAKETSLAERGRLIKSKEQDVEAQARAATERLIALEKDEARREVLGFLGSMDFPSLVKAFEEIEEEPEEKPTSTPEVPPPPPDFQTFIESIEPDEEETHVLLQLAELALEGGDASMALLRYEQALQRDGRNPDAWAGKGVSLQQLERYREALDAYDRALSLKPDHALAQKWRATCLRHLEAEGVE